MRKERKKEEEKKSKATKIKKNTSNVAEGKAENEIITRKSEKRKRK